MSGSLRQPIEIKMHRPPRRTFALMFIVLLLFANAYRSFAYADASTNGGSSPTIVPSPRGVHGFPFDSTVIDLSASGFVETEFLMSGSATAYEPASAFGKEGRWKAMPNPGVTAAYTTRLLVRRPLNPKNFNGIVIVEWLNVSAGFDNSAEWAYAHDEFLKEGYAFVGVTAQFVGAQGLLAWEAGEKGDRYKTIFHPGDSFSYDIFTQAARAIRGAAVQPLGDLTSHIAKIIGHGYSQSAFALFTYINAIAPLVGAYDGFLMESGGFGFPLSVPSATFFGSGTVPPGVPATPFIDVPYPANMRDNGAAPVLMVAGEYDVNYLGVGPVINFEADTAHFHLWEIAGMAHFDPINQDLADAVKTMPGTTDGFASCTLPPPNSGIPAAYAIRAANYQIGEWARSGIPPRSAPRLKISINSEDFAHINRDGKTGIAIGGIRFPVVDVPIGTMTGHRLRDANCFPEAGSYDPWDNDTDAWDGQAEVDPSPTPEPTLLTLYPTHEDYVQQVANSALNSVSLGFMRPDDAVEAVTEAQASSVP